MNFHILNHEIKFPSVETADEDGLVAIGGDISIERILLAYQSGIFPWYNEGEEPILWWSPNPRFVLFPEKLKVSKSMKAIFKKGIYSFTINQAFEQVIIQCQQIKRKGVNGTWLNDDMLQTFIQLHKMGIAHSAECWYNNKLVGGLYGIKLKNVFCGESMFSLQSNASKFAFICYVQQLKQDGIQLIDCQIHSAHLESLGAEMIPRNDFIKFL